MIEKVIDILVNFTTLEKNMITEKSSLVTDLGLSSLDVINVVVAFEDEFDIEIPSLSVLLLCLSSGNRIQHHRGRKGS